MCQKLVKLTLFKGSLFNYEEMCQKLVKLTLFKGSLFNYEEMCQKRVLKKKKKDLRIKLRNFNYRYNQEMAV